MGLRTDLLIGPVGGGTVSGGTSPWADLISQGMTVLGTYLGSRGQRAMAAPAPLASAAFPVVGALARLAALVARYGGRILGRAVTFARATWTRLPPSVQQTIIALVTAVGFELTFDDEEAPTEELPPGELPAYGGELEAYQGLPVAAGRKLAKFQMYVQAGVPPAIAARISSITRGRRQGISGAQLRGFHRVVGLLRKVGMRPRALGGGGRRFPRKRA